MNTRRRTYIGGWEDMEVLFCGTISYNSTIVFNRPVDIDNEGVLVIGNVSALSTSQGKILHRLYSKADFISSNPITLRYEVGNGNSSGEIIYGGSGNYMKMYTDKITEGIDCNLLILAVPLTK